MRKRFEQELTIGQLPIEETKISPKSTHALDQLLAALLVIYCDKDYNERLFGIMEKYLTQHKQKTGRRGMDLWCIFVLSQVRLCLNYDYNTLHNQVNNHHTLRQVMGIEKGFGYEPVQISYQNIYDNVSLISDEMVKEINQLIVEFGHKKVFKKKEKEPLHLKTDSFVVESNVHFPTDYNLLWDCIRKILDIVVKMLANYPTQDGWRKIKSWRRSLKGLMRAVGRASASGGKNKQTMLVTATKKYLDAAKALLFKLKRESLNFPIKTAKDEALMMSLFHFMELLEKHIDLVNRRIIEKEQIPHDEKMFSIFETYTEFIKKGKSRPNVELGKKLAITTDQFNLIVDYHILEKEQDRDIVIGLADRILAHFKVKSWSFDKGYWNKDNKQLLQLEVEQVIMPKLGKRNKEESKEENSRRFVLLKNQHSAVESNINELENRGLDRCPDKGYQHFKRYIGLGVCAYNLKKMGKHILETELKEHERYKRLAA